MPQREAYDLPMTYVDDEALADIVQETIEGSMRGSERTQWAQSQKIGVSDIGHCRRYLQLLVAGEPFSDEDGDSMAAFVGTAIGDLVEKNLGGDWVTQDTVVVTLDVETPGGAVRLNLPGHPDAYSTELDRMVDLKSKASLEVARRYGPSLQQKIQPTLYAHALIAAGKLTPDCTVSLAYLDRSAQGGSRPVVYSWKYDEQIVRLAQAWLSDVFEASVTGRDAPCDKERQWCMDYCPFASVCRQHDTDVEGLLDEERAVAAEVYLEAMKDERDARRRKEQAKGILGKVAGNTRSGLSVRSVEVPPSYMEGGWRRGYDRLSVTPLNSTRKKS